MKLTQWLSAPPCPGNICNAGQLAGEEERAAQDGCVVEDGGAHRGGAAHELSELVLGKIPKSKDCKLPKVPAPRSPYP